MGVLSRCRHSSDTCHILTHPVSEIWIQRKSANLALTGHDRFLVIIPGVIQGMVDDAHLPIRSGSLEAFSNNEVAVGLSTELDGPTDLTVRMDPFEMYLYNEDTEGFYSFTSVLVPGHAINAKTQIDIKKETVAVTNYTELKKWLTRAVRQKDVNISVKAETTAHWGAIKAHVDIDKTEALGGLDRLSGLRISSMGLIRAEENGGDNFQGTLILPNHSPLSIGLDDLMLNTWAGDALIGNATTMDVYLQPGDNTLAFRGQIFLEAVMMKSEAIITSQASTLSDGYLELGISGDSSVSNGEHTSYVEDVLSGIRFKARLHENEVLGGLARSLMGPHRTVILSDVLGGFLGGVDPMDILDLIGFDVEAWDKALKDALEGKTKAGTLLGLLSDLA